MHAAHHPTVYLFTILQATWVRRTFLLAPLVLALALAGCASQPLRTFADVRPVFRPEQYFAGQTHSWGVFEKRKGEPTKIILTKTTGVWDGTALRFEQDIIFPAENKKSHRTWLIRRVDDRHYTATGTGIVGTARGEATGNAFHLEFTLDALPGNPLGHVHMSQWMYLQEDGTTLINRATVTKAGIILAHITEQFRKHR